MKKSILMIAVLVMSALAMVSCKKDDNNNSDSNNKGDFTINANGDKVNFAPGNLYWNGSSFEFEANQWDFPSLWAPNHVGHFFYLKEASYACAEEFGGDWTESGVCSWGDEFFTNATEITPNPGFTVNGQKGVWRTLSDEEWTYLVNERKVQGRRGYGNTCVCATVNDVNGLIIFCDDYSGETSNLKAIPEGCVFLPDAGWREGSAIKFASSLSEYRMYWASLCGDEYFAWAFSFDGDYCSGLPCHGVRDEGLAVRLVRSAN